VLHERLTQSAERADDRAAKLAIHLITSRVEGEAVGILMAKHKATEEEAVGLQRQVSWTSQRQLHEAAADLVRTADLQRGPHNRAGSHARREHLHVAASHGP
jgi:AmiR/NasT family two-component response regulator